MEGAGGGSLVPLLGSESGDPPNTLFGATVGSWKRQRNKRGHGGLGWLMERKGVREQRDELTGAAPSLGVPFGFAEPSLPTPILRSPTSFSEELAERNTSQASKNSVCESASEAMLRCERCCSRPLAGSMSGCRDSRAQHPLHCPPGPNPCPHITSSGSSEAKESMVVSEETESEWKRCSPSRGSRPGRGACGGAELSQIPHSILPIPCRGSGVHTGSPRPPAFGRSRDDLQRTPRTGAAPPDLCPLTPARPPQAHSPSHPSGTSTAGAWG